MNRKTTLIGSDSDPAIQNRKAAPQTKIQNRQGWSRREFLSAAALAGTGALLGLPDYGIAAEPPPETTRIKLAYHSRSLCHAPLVRGRRFLAWRGVH